MSKKYFRDYRRTHVEQARARDRAYYHRLSLEALLYRGAKKRAKERGIKFTLRLEDIIVPKYCPLLGMRLQRGIKTSVDSSPTLDRKKPSRGYVRGNIWVISAKANRMKSDASLAEMIRLVRNWRTHEHTSTD
jgi:hypothetical protein